MKMNHVAGKNKGNVVLYALTTCVWCRKTKQLLNQLHVEYQYIDVDLLQEDEKEKITEEIKIFNPRCSFPTLVIDHNKCIVGFEKEKIEEALRA